MLVIAALAASDMADPPLNETHAPDIFIDMWADVPGTAIEKGIVRLLT